jgi:hypothetical protein
MTRNSTKNHNRRNANGSMLAIVMLVTTVLIIPIAMFSQSFIQIGLSEQQNSSNAQAAALVAAQELSRIVISDPNWGYISLSNHPAIGKNTLAPDGEPLPVLGINTILATARLECLIAEKLNDEDLRTLAHEDARTARAAALRLSNALQDAVSAKSKERYYDMDGNRVTPYDHARRLFYRLMYSASSGSGRRTVNRFSLSLGWLRNGVSSGCSLPQPAQLASVGNRERIGNNYIAFKNVPVDSEEFYFAGLSAQSCLVPVDQWAPADGRRPCSAVKLEADITHAGIGLNCSDVKLRSCVSAIPDSEPDYGATGSLVMHFPHGYVPGLHTLRDYICHKELKSTKAEAARAIGDYPEQVGSRLQESTDLIEKAGQATAIGFSDWIRCNRHQVRLDSMFEILDSQMPRIKAGCDGTTLIYSINRNGNVHLKQLAEGFFRKQILSDRQLYAISNAAVRTQEGAWLAILHDQVRALGEAGGQHRGQALVGQIPRDCAQDAVDPNTLPFDIGQARKSFINGGLAVSLEFSAPH